MNGDSQTPPRQIASAEIQEPLQAMVYLTKLVGYLNQFQHGSNNVKSMQEQDERQKEDIARLKIELDHIKTYRDEQLQRVMRENEDHKAELDEFMNSQADVDAMRRQIQNDQENLERAKASERQQLREEMKERLRLHKEKLLKEATEKLDQLKETQLKELQDRDAKIADNLRAAKEQETFRESEKKKDQDKIDTLEVATLSMAESVRTLQKTIESLEIVNGLVEHDLDF